MQKQTIRDIVEVAISHVEDRASARDAAPPLIRLVSNRAVYDVATKFLRNYASPEDVRVAFDELADVLDISRPDSVIPETDAEFVQMCPTLYSLARAGAERPSIHLSLYAALAAPLGLPALPTAAGEVRRSEALENLKGELAAQKILFPKVVETFVDVDEVWRGQNKDVKLTCENGHTFMRKPKYIRERLASKPDATLCHKCNNQGHGTDRIELEALQQGYSLMSSEGHQNTWKYQCDTCGAVRKRPRQSIKDWRPCESCEPAGVPEDDWGEAADPKFEENETVWVALDKDPYFHAFVWVGRMPQFLHNLYTSGQIIVEPVFAEVTSLQPDNFFIVPEPRRGRKAFDAEYEPIMDVNAEGVKWQDPVYDWCTDQFIRALTCKSRATRAHVVVPAAIDYIAGRNEHSRYAGDDGFLPLNTSHNAEFLRWTNGKPVYTFEVDESPLSIAFGLWSNK